MKQTDKQDTPVTASLLQDLAERSKSEAKLRNPVVESKPLDPAALYQDSGNGYNPGFVFPQQ